MDVGYLRIHHPGLSSRYGRMSVYVAGSIIVAVGTFLFPFAPTSGWCFFLRAMQVCASDVFTFHCSIYNISI